MLPDARLKGKRTLHFAGNGARARANICFTRSLIFRRVMNCGRFRSVRTLYNILFWGFFVAAAPYYFWRLLRRGNWRAGFGERFGQYDTKLKQAITNRHNLWLHAVSVGEVNLCTQLIRALEPRLPNAKLIVSTTTTTGMGELKKKLPIHVSKVYYPV